MTPWYPTADAPESGVFVAREAEALAEAHDVRVLHLDWSGRPGRAPVPGRATVRRLALRRANPLDYVRARRAVRRASADVVHTHALTGLIPWLVGRPARGPWVHSEHWSAITSPETRPRLERAALRGLLPLLRRPAVVVAESSRLADAIARSRRGPLAIVPCVVPPVEVRPLPRRNRLIGVGGLIDRKGPLTAVETLAALRARGVDADLTWVGDGPLRDAVRRRAADLGVLDRVHLTGTLPGPELDRRYEAADLLLLPTRGDNFCVVAAEALVHGRPIVSGARTGAVDYADPAVSRFVESADAGAYADAVASLLAATADRTAEQVAATVAGRFDPAAVRAALEEVYRRAGV